MVKRDGESVEARKMLRRLRAAWWILALGAVAGGLVAAVLSLLASPEYQARTEFFVSTTQANTTADVFQGSQFSEDRVASYARLLEGKALAGRVIERMGIAATPAEVASAISASPVPNTVLLEVVVASSSPTEAHAIASAVGEIFPAYVSELETSDGRGVSPVKVAVTDPPETPTSRSAPQTMRNTVVGVIAGMFAAIILVMLAVRWDRSVRDAATVTDAIGAPVVGVIVKDAALARNETLKSDSTGPAAEAYRQLRTNLQYLSVDEPPKVIMLSSALPGEGKTTVAVNLAVLLAEAGQHVTLVEADLRRPRVTRYLGMVGGVGLTNILAGSAEVVDVLQPYGDGNLKVIAAGSTPPNPSELLASSQMFKLVDQLREANDFVLIDAPPLLPVADASGLAVIVDGVVLSVRYGSTRSEQLQQARAMLDQVGARTLGVILNIVPPKADITQAYGYGYDYASDRVPQPGND